MRFFLGPVGERPFLVKHALKYIFLTSWECQREYPPSCILNKALCMANNNQIFNENNILYLQVYLQVHYISTTSSIAP